jgi:hypothetical protein
MTYSNFIILLARQRSGTNAVRSVLGSHPDICGLNEVFNLGHKDSKVGLLRETNYFNFLAKYAQGDVDRILPDKHEKLFLDFLEHLRGFSSKRYMLVDVKYNTTHFLTEPHKRTSAPYLLFLIKKHGLLVLNFTRRNYLRYIVSQLKAMQSGIWTVSTSETAYVDHKIQIDLDYLLSHLDYCQAESQLIEKSFCRYPGLLSHDYEDVFPAPTGAVAGDFLESVSKRLGIENSFKQNTRYKKQSCLSLEETIENFEEVAKALRGTRFEYCLQDEKMYLKSSAGTQSAAGNYASTTDNG